MKTRAFPALLTFAVCVSALRAAESAPAALAPAAVAPAASAASATAAAPANELTAAEKADGWVLLFDGKTFAGWRGYREKGPPARGWEIKDGLLKTVPRVSGGSQPVTEKTFTDFELTWEWRIAEGGNNGIKYFVTESRPSAPGPEYQMIDDARHADAKRGPLYQTGAFYDVLPPAVDKPLKPAGEWNASRLVVKGNHVEHWLNGKMILAYEVGSPEVKAGIARSKFKGEAGFGDKIATPILLTYHDDECWYRNIKIRELPAK
jgi:hypothetical protein